MRGIHEGCVLDLFMDVLVLIEGECAREGDVDDDPGAPHVQGPVVPLIPQHLHQGQFNVLSMNILSMKYFVYEYFVYEIFCI